MTKRISSGHGLPTGFPFSLGSEQNDSLFISGVLRPRRSRHAVKRKPTEPTRRTHHTVLRKESAVGQSVKKIPTGYNVVTPYLVIKDAAAAIAFYTAVFDACEQLRMNDLHGRIAHAEIQIGDSKLMLADEQPEMGGKSPLGYGGSPIRLHLYVEDVDAVIARAIEAGASESRAIKNTFYGDRSGVVQDPFGYTWHVATHVEDVSVGERERRAAAFSQREPSMPLGPNI
jgi:PhnB protein